MLRTRQIDAQETRFPSEAAFPEAEYTERLERVRRSMRDAGLDLLLVHSLPNICYLTGYQTPLSDWYHCLIVPSAGAVTLQVCDTELARVNTYVERIEPVLWEHTDGAAEQLAHLMDAQSIRAGRIGVELRRPGLTPYLFNQLRATFPHCDFVDASTLVLGVRVVKSPREIECLRQAARYSAVGIEAAIAAIRPGVTDNALTAAASAAMIEAGSEYFSIDPIVRTGWRSGVIHANCKRQIVEPGETIFMEFGGVHQRYCAPLLRTAVIGSPSDQVRSLADQSLTTLGYLFEAIRPGRTIDDVVRSTLSKAPSLQGATRTRGYFGYSVGISFPPVWVEHSLALLEGSTEVLQPNMVFHAHRSLRVPLQLSVSFSETILVTETGCEPLTRHPRELCVVPL
jgi:Xaa-Pro aminopeptidase